MGKSQIDVSEARRRLLVLPALTWSEIFLAIDALSRRGDIALYRDGFTYIVELASDHS